MDQKGVNVGSVDLIEVGDVIAVDHDGNRLCQGEGCPLICHSRMIGTHAYHGRSYHNRSK